MKKIHLGGKHGSIIGNYALVDDEDFEYLNQLKWHCTKRLYVSRRLTVEEISKNHGKQGVIMIHRIIMETPKDMSTDHINHDTLDNRKENLRVCTQAENAMNRNKNFNSKSGYKGVHLNSTGKKWCGRIKKNNKIFRLGLFQNPIEAAKAYDKKALEFYLNEKNPNNNYMKKLLLIPILSLLFIGAGCVPKQPTGCDRFKSYYAEDCRWCEENGGRYFAGGWGSSECVFPPVAK